LQSPSEALGNRIVRAGQNTLAPLDAVHLRGKIIHGRIDLAFRRSSTDQPACLDLRKWACALACASNTAAATASSERSMGDRLQRWRQSKSGARRTVQYPDLGVEYAGLCRIKTSLFNNSAEHAATIGFNESYGLWQIVVVNREETEFFCPSKEVAFAAWKEEFDPETGFPRSTSTGIFDA